MNNHGHVGDQDMIHENPQSPNDLLLQILQETQLKLETMEKRMSEMAAQIGQNREEAQATSSHKANTKFSECDKTPSPKQLEKQKKEIAADIKKIKLPKFSGSESGEEAEAWLTKMEQYFEIRNFSKTSKVVWGIYHFTEEATTWWGNTKVEKNIKTTEITWEKFVSIF